MEESDHEEADTRICLHVHNALKNVATIVLIRTVDTDMIVILVGVFHDLLQQHPDMQLWVGFGMGKHFRYYHVNSICQELGEDYHLSMHSLALMQHHSSVVKAKSQFGGHGNLIQQ